MPSAEQPRDTEGLPEPGDLLAGKYRVERVVGVGGMGVVVAAVHVQLEERVALKLMRREVMNPETIGRFLREARSAAKIKSEHVARVTDVGVLDEGTPYMVMELLEGEDLGHRVQERGPLAPGEAVDYVLQACEAVAEAHALGIVHRDLKPSNLFLARRPGGRRVVKVVDFGISKQIANEGLPAFEEGAKTRTSAWLGSPLYMSPEQMRSAKDVDARADLWSLGLILYELCTGHVPFDAPSLVELCGRVLHDAPTPIGKWLPEAPPALVAAIARCLEKNRDERYADVGVLALDLAEVAPAGGRDRAQRIVSVLRGGGSNAPSERPPPLDDDAQPVPLVRPQNLPEYEVEMGSTDRTPLEDPRIAAARTGGPESPPNPPRAAAPAAEPVSARTVARSSTSPAETEPRQRDEARRHGGGAGWMILALLLAAGGSGAYLRQRSGEWPFAAQAAPKPTEITGDAPAPPATASASPAASAQPPVVVPAPVPSSAAVAIVDAGAFDSGLASLPGARRALRKGLAGAPEAPDHAAVPAPTAPSMQTPPRPEILSETCFQTLGDGSRKPIPCP